MSGSGSLSRDDSGGADDFDCPPSGGHDGSGSGSLGVSFPMMDSMKREPFSPQVPQGPQDQESGSAVVGGAALENPALGLDVALPTSALGSSTMAQTKRVDPGWTPEKEQLLKDWAQQSLGYAWMHERSAKSYNRWHTFLSIPAVLLSGGVGVSVLGVDNATTTSRLVQATVSLLTGGIISLQAFLKYEKAAEQHMQMYRQFVSFHSDIITEMALPRMERHASVQYINDLKKKWKEMIRAAPNIPTAIIEDFSSRMKTFSSVSKPFIAFPGEEVFEIKIDSNGSSTRNESTASDTKNNKTSSSDNSNNNNNGTDPVTDIAASVSAAAKSLDQGSLFSTDLLKSFVPPEPALLGRANSSVRNVREAQEPSVDELNRFVRSSSVRKLQNIESQANGAVSQRVQEYLPLDSDSRSKSREEFQHRRAAIMKKHEEVRSRLSALNLTTTTGNIAAVETSSVSNPGENPFVLAPPTGRLRNVVDVNEVLASPQEVGRHVAMIQVQGQSGNTSSTTAEELVQVSPSSSESSVVIQQTVRQESITAGDQSDLSLQSGRRRPVRESQTIKSKPA